MGSNNYWESTNAPRQSTVPAHGTTVASCICPHDGLVGSTNLVEEVPHARSSRRIASVLSAIWRLSDDPADAGQVPVCASLGTGSAVATSTSQRLYVHVA